MADNIAVQHRRGTKAQNDGFTGLIGELSMDTTQRKLRLHDGVKLGGFPLAMDAVVDVRSYGAKGDGVTDDGAAIAAAIAAVPAGGVLYFGGSDLVYVVDTELIVTSAMRIRADGATIKLKTNATIFTISNGYGRYMLHIRASDVLVEGLKFDGNSANNSVIVTGNTRYRYSSGGTVNSVGCIVVGYAPIASAADISNVTIRNCEFKDSPDTCISFFNQDGIKLFYNCRTEHCTFIRGQNVQHDINNCRNFQAIGHRHINAYFCSFQFYYNNIGCQAVGATTWHKDSEITAGLVDYGLLTAGALTFHGYWKLGKDSTAPNINCAVKDCQFYGTGIYIGDGMSYSLIDGNTIDSAEKIPGIEYAGPATDQFGNVISNNLIRNCDFPGIYHGGDQTVAGVVLYEGNRLFGNSQSAAQYGGRDTFANIFLIGKGGIFRNNFARKVGTKPTYGVKQFAGQNIAGTKFLLNDLEGSGDTLDLSPVTPPIGAMIGDLRIWEWTLPSTASQAGAFDVVPTGDGILFFSGGVEAGMFAIKSDGTATLIAGSANMDDADTLNKLCVVDNGTNVYLRNQLAAGAQNLRAVFFYR